MPCSDFDYLTRFDDGSFSIVYKVRRKENSESENKDEIFALKQQKSDDEWVAMYTKNEEKIIKKLKHPNIIGFYDSWVEDNKLNLLIEFASGGSLLDLLFKAIDEDLRKPMRETEALFFFSQLLLGLDHMYNNDILHRDLKPENVLFAGPLQRVKIVDFNLSLDLALEEEDSLPVVNPNSYSAIEVWNDEEHTFGSDVWSIGALLYEVATGFNPANLKDDLEPLEDLPLAIKTICTSIFKQDPNDRPSTTQLIRYPELKPHICLYYDSLDSSQQELVLEQVYDVAADESSNSVETDDVADETMNSVEDDVVADETTNSVE